jgi:hypothetical protein
MAAPSASEYGTASAAAYTLQNSGGFTPPSGWTLIETSSTTQQSDGFAAVALKDPSGNIIIGFEGTVVGLSTFDKGTLAADQQIMTNQSPAALADAAAFAQQIQTLTGSDSIFVTGHSLGGDDAEAACKALGSHCAGGMTFGATGLPGNTAAGNPNLLNEVDWGDPIGNYSTDSSSPLKSLIDGNMQHYGPVQMTGSQSNATALQNAATEINAALTASDNGAYFGEGDASADVLAGVVSMAWNLQFHFRTNYASDLKIPSLAGNPTAEGNDGAALSLSALTFPLANGQQIARSATVSATSSCTLDSPTLDMTLNPTTNQFTFDQLQAVKTVSGATQASGIGQLAVDQSNATGTLVAGQDAGSATITLSGNSFDISDAPGLNTLNTDLIGQNCSVVQNNNADGIQVLPGASGTITGSTDSIYVDAGATVTAQGNGDYAYAANGVTVTQGGTKDFWTLGTSDTVIVEANSQVTVIGNSDATSGGADDNVTINGSSDTLTEGSGSTWTVDGSSDKLTITAASSSATFAGSGETVSATSDTLSFGNSSTGTVTGNNNRLTLGTSVALTLNGTGETASASSDYLTLGNSASATVTGTGNSFVLGTSDTVTLGAKSSATLTGNSDTIEDNGSDTVTADGSGNTYTESSGDTWTINGSTDRLTISAASSTATLNGTSETVTATSDTVNLGANATATVTGNSNTLGLGTGVALTLNGSSEKATGSSDYFTLGSSGSATITGSSNSVTTGSSETVTLNGNSESVTLGSSSKLTLTGTSNKITSTSDTLSLGSSSKSIVAGTSNTATLTSSDQIFVDGSSNTVNVVAGDIVDLASNVTVTISGSGAKIVGNTGDTISITGTSDNIYADSSSITVNGTDTGDVVHGSGDTGNRTNWGGYVSESGAYGGYSGGGYYSHAGGKAIRARSGSALVNIADIGNADDLIQTRPASLGSTPRVASQSGNPSDKWPSFTESLGGEDADSNAATPSSHYLAQQLIEAIAAWVPGGNSAATTLDESSSVAVPTHLFAQGTVDLLRREPHILAH